MKRKKPTPFLAKHTLCTGCMACVDICPVSALRCSIFTDGHIYPECDNLKCINCKQCIKVCPILNNYEYTSSTFSLPMAAWINNDKVRQNSASGGVFAGLAYYFLSIGGCVAGAIMEGVKVKHIIIDKVEDIRLLQGSKYQQGDLSGIYNKVLERLKKKQPILFSGTPCQIVGLYSFLRYKKNLINPLLYTIDIVCGGFPSFLPMKRFLLEHQDIKEIKSFRDKSTGWKSRNYTYSLKVINSKDEQVDYGNRNIVIGSFCSRLTHRSSCLKCRFALPHRKSDITIMDFWGDTNFLKEHFLGLSVAVIHTNKGKELFNKAKIVSYPIKWKDFLPFNPRMVCGNTYFLHIHPSRLFYSFFFNHLTYSIISFLYNGRKILVLSHIYKSILFINNKLNMIYKRLYINKLINILDDNI